MSNCLIPVINFRGDIMPMLLYWSTHKLEADPNQTLIIAIVIGCIAVFSIALIVYALKKK